MRRAIGLAFMMGFGNIGGLIGSYIYKDSEKPKYPTGYGASLAFGAMGVCCCLGLEFALWRINKKNEALSPAEVREKYTDDELAKLGDKSPLYNPQLSRAAAPPSSALLSR